MDFKNMKRREEMNAKLEKMAQSPINRNERWATESS
jgi:hypothetical protein